MGIVNKLLPALIGFALAAATAAMAADHPAAKADHLLVQAKRATGGAAWDRLKSLGEPGAIADQAPRDVVLTPADLI